VGNTIILSAEDGEKDTIKPRLEAARADCQRVIIPPLELSDGRFLTLPDHTKALERANRATAASLVIVDPLSAFMNPKLNSNRDEDVRQALTPLRSTAERTGAAIIVIRHLTKGSGGTNPIYRSGGSIGIIGAARAGHLVARDPIDDKVRLFVPYKYNLSEKAPGLRFRLIRDESDKAAHIEWIKSDTSGDYSARDLLRAAVAQDDNRSERDSSKLAEAIRFLVAALMNGPRLVREVEAAAENHGIRPKTLRSGREKLKVETDKEKKFDGDWIWRLPDREGSN
jgi:hypothetical protein